MAHHKQQCFDDLQFNRFLENQTDAIEEARILAHIATCQQCQSALEKLAGHQKVWSEIRNHLAESQIDFPEDETQDINFRDQQRDLQKVQNMLAPTDNPEMLGRLGGYEVRGVIGRGSAGIVVKALDTRLNRYVAIKLLAPVYSNIGCSRRRFEREGRAIASVKDPHVVPIHTVDEFQGTPYIVMQYMPDGSLLQRIQKQGPLNTDEVVCIGMQIAKGLAAAHARGIVHRDVKPANVLLENGINGAMVTDFGLARVVDEATMTRSGSISGTPQYMSPEQAKGERVDPRSDLFSLGSVMYAACTGHAPFKSESVFGVIKKVCESEPLPIREFNPDIAPWLVGLVSRLHAKSPQERFESADEVAELLSHELAHLQAPTMVAKPARDWWEKKTAQSRAGFFGSRAALIGAAIVTATIAGLFAFNGFGNFNSNNPAGLPTMTAGPENSFGLGSLLAFTKKENEKLPQFKNSVAATIDVKTDGQLFLRTNLGTLDISTHDKPTVELKLIHTVGAKDQETADKLFKAMKIEYGLDTALTRDAKLTKGADAAIVATFPTRKLTEQEIEQADDLEDLKEQLLIRNNSHFRNAEFELLVPKDFNLDLQTHAGPIKTSDINGWAKLLTQGGPIEVGNITGKVNFTTDGGHVDTGDLDSDATIRTDGGHIEIGNVNGELFAHTSSGHICADMVTGSVDAMTHGGHVELGHTVGAVKAKSLGGGVKIWMAESQVQVEASSGSIKVNFVGQPDGDSTLITDAGSIKVGYVEDLGFDINASGGLAKISAPFKEKKTNELQYQLNDGKNKLTVNAGNGSIKFYVIDEDETNEQFEENREESRGRRAFQRAYDLHMEGKIDEAIEAHKRAAKFERYKGIATYNLGCAWALKDEKDKAFAALNDAIDFGFTDAGQFESDKDLDSLRKDERFDDLMSKLGKRPDKTVSFVSEPEKEVEQLVKLGKQKYREKEFSKAEESFRSALALDADNEFVAVQLGVAIHAQGRLSEAYKWHERSAKSKKYADLGNYNLACIHSLRNETDEAVKFMTRAIDHGFTDVAYMKTDDDLSNLRKDERFSKLVKLAKERCDSAECENGSEKSDH